MAWVREDIPWRQGHLLDENAIRQLGLGAGEAGQPILAIIATHDCDIAQDPAAEPDIEIVLGNVVDEANGNNTHAKNARTLHLKFSTPAVLWGEFRAVAKRKIKKTDLVAFNPRSDATLDTENHAIFQTWLASRYRRSAFPDEFENRLLRKSKLAEKISKAVKKHGEHIVGVFFDVDEGEEIARQDDQDVYTLDITILHKADVGDGNSERIANEVATRIETAFASELRSKDGEWRLIELRFCEAVSETVLSYDQYKLLKRWRLDHMSLAAEPQQEIPAD